MMIGVALLFAFLPVGLRVPAAEDAASAKYFCVATPAFKFLSTV